MCLKKAEALAPIGGYFVVQSLFTVAPIFAGRVCVFIHLQLCSIKYLVIALGKRELVALV